VGVPENLILNLLHGLGERAVEASAGRHLSGRIETFFERGNAPVRAHQLAAPSENKQGEIRLSAAHMRFHVQELGHCLDIGNLGPYIWIYGR